MDESAAPTLEHVTYIDAPVERVYETLTTAAGWDAWFTNGTTLEAAPGGQIRLRWVNFGAERMTTDDGGPVLEVQQNRKFAFQWQPGRVATTVSFELETRGAGNASAHAGIWAFNGRCRDCRLLRRRMGRGAHAAEDLAGTRRHLQRGAGSVAGDIELPASASGRFTLE